MTTKGKVSLSKTLSEAFELWKTHFLRIAIITFVVYLPVQVIIELISILFEPTNLETAEDWRKLSNEVRVYDFVRQLFGIIATLGILNLILSVLRNDDLGRSWQDYLKYGLLSWPRYIVVAFKAGLIILLYTFLLIVPGIYKGVRLSLIDCSFVDGDDDPLLKSETTVEGRWFTIFGFGIVIFLIGLGLELIIALPFLALPDSHLVTILIGVFANILTSYTIVVKAKYYHELTNLDNETLGEPNESIELKD